MLVEVVARWLGERLGRWLEENPRVRRELGRAARRYRRYRLVAKVLAGTGLLRRVSGAHIGELRELAERLGVPAREDCVRNFVAAYAVVRNLMTKREADAAVASSSRGRRRWEKRIRSALPT